MLDSTTFRERRISFLLRSFDKTGSLWACSVVDGPLIVFQVGLKPSQVPMIRHVAWTFPHSLLLSALR